MDARDSAESALRRALAIDDGCVYSHLALGEILTQERSYDSAATEFRAVIARAPDFIGGYTSLSDVLIQSHRLAVSESVLVACAGLFPDAVDPVLRLARVRLVVRGHGCGHQGLYEPDRAPSGQPRDPQFAGLNSTPAPGQPRPGQLISQISSPRSANSPTSRSLRATGSTRCRAILS